MVISITVFEKQDPNTVKLLVKGLDETYVNGLRRTLAAEVPVMAIEDAEIRKNNSIMYDEILAHRLGLIPFKTDLKSYDVYQEGEPLNAKNSLSMTLKAKGPGYVYASQIKTKDPKVVPVYPKTIIAKLLEGQEIELEATAVLGKGKKHAKWSPGMFFHHYATDITIKKQPNEQEREALMKTFPKGLFEVKAGKLVVKDKQKAMECEDFEGVNPHITITPQQDMIFGIESWGQLTPKELVTQAVISFDGLLDELHDAIKTIP